MGTHTETQEKLVIYRALYQSPRSDMLYLLRPLTMFTENVTKEGKTFLRFRRITDPEIIAQLTEIRDEMYPQTNLDTLCKIACT